eukprot:symbB.v1.2.006891.t1/scaffold413.1/size265838/15
MDRDEIHHKMSKKVAQLTKVIFHLNTRNDEAEHHLAAVCQAYESEVDQILKDANAKVRKLAEAVESGQGSKAGKQLEALKSNYEDEKREALREIQNVKSAATARENKNTAMWKERLSNMNGEVQALKQQCQVQASQFKSALERLQARKFRMILHLAHAAELQRLQTQHQAKLNRLNEDHQATEESLKGEIKEQKVAHDRQLQQEKLISEELRDQLTRAKKSLEDSLASGGEALQAAFAERDHLESEIKKLQDETATLRQEAAERSEALKLREKDMESLKDSLVSSEKAAAALKADLEVLKRNYADSQEELARLQSKHQDLLDKSKREQGQLEASTALEKHRLEDELKASEAELRMEVTSKEEEVRKQHSLMEEQRSELDRLQKALAEATQRQEDLERQGGSEVQRLQAELQSHKEKIQTLENDMKAQALESQRRLDQAAITASQEIEAERSAHANVVETLERSHEQVLVETQQAHLAEIASLRAELEAEVQRLRSQLESTDQDGQRLLKEREADLKGLSEQLQVLQARLEETKHLADEERRVKEELQSQLAEAQAESAVELKRLQGEMEKHQEDHAAAMERLRDDYQKEIRLLTEKHAKEIQGLKEEMKHALETRGREGVAEVHRLQDEIRQQKAGYEEEIRILKKKIEDLENSLQASQKDAEVRSSNVAFEKGFDEFFFPAQGQLRDMEATMRLEVEKVRTEGIEMVQRLSSEHEAKLEDVFRKNSAALEQLQQKLGDSSLYTLAFDNRLLIGILTMPVFCMYITHDNLSTHTERIDEMRTKHARELEGLKTAHAAEVRDAAAAHKAALQEVRSEMARAVKELENAAKVAAERHATEVRSLNAALESERKELESARLEAKGLQEDLGRARAATAELEAKFKATVTQHEESMRRRLQEFEKEKRHMKEQHKRGQLESAAEGHLSMEVNSPGVEQLLEEQAKEIEISALKEQFDCAKNLQEMQISMQQQRIVELENLYNSRPSREEDLQLIAQLETDVQAKSAQITKLLDDMQFYKLELVNREQNYNKVFGAEPTIGIMNPIAKKPSGPNSGAPPQMRVVQQPGAGMNGMNIGLPRS